VGENRNERTVTYCVVPRELAPALHELLRTHFRENPAVEVVVEMRESERRKDQRRTPASDATEAAERRMSAAEGRRIEERRQPQATAPPIELPRDARRHRDALLFVRRELPTDQNALDAANARLVRRFQAGDDTAFAEIYMANFASVFSYVRIALRDHHEAEDVTQHVFLKVMNALPRYEVRGRTPFRAWLFRITRNETITHHRKHRRLEVEDPTSVDERRSHEEVEHIPLALDWISDHDLLQFIERLPELQRQAIVLRYMLELSTEEMCEVLDRSAVAVRKLEHRALRFLESRLSAVRERPEHADHAPMVMRARRGPVLAARRSALGAPLGGHARGRAI
jgi:RNA polymerase sigma-70 factor (ECF subfamily)